jgi:WD40 repeat protein
MNTCSHAVDFSPDGQTIASCDSYGTVHLIDILGNIISKPLQGNMEPNHPSVAFSPNGEMVASGGSALQLWDISGNTIKKPFVGHRDSVHSVAFSPDGKTIVSGSWDGTVRIWDLSGHCMAKPFQGHQGGVCSIAFSPDGKTMSAVVMTERYACGVFLVNLLVSLLKAIRRMFIQLPSVPMER